MLKNEPVMVFAALLAAALAIVGISVDINTAVIVVSAIAPIVAGLLQRFKVTPNAKVDALILEETTKLAAALSRKHADNLARIELANKVVPPATGAPPVV